uniref:Cadherin domain-containing protein n=1 Tax=Astyanax mexicanus TaxID=7994 RepID=A0A3B1J4Y8_ASTMX
MPVEKPPNVQLTHNSLVIFRNIHFMYRLNSFYFKQHMGLQCRCLLSMIWNRLTVNSEMFHNFFCGYKKEEVRSLQVSTFISLLTFYRLRRTKQEWIIPPISFLENRRGPIPKGDRIKSSHAKETKMVYSITGEGADQPPVGLFTINKNTGWLSVTKPLDRETKDKYVLQVHSIAADSEIKEDPMEIIFNVIDQNDNKPIFTQNPFLGSVPEASTRGVEFMTVTATDADDPETDHADVRYSIISQTPPLPDPNMFIINSITGGIRVNSDGKKNFLAPRPPLFLVKRGPQTSSTGTAVITVTDSNDNAPKFEKTLYTTSVPENKVGAVVVKLPVTDGDEPQSPAWMAKFRIISGNNGGFFSISTTVSNTGSLTPYTLLVIAENEVPFANPLQTSTATATVIVNVQDVNEAPVFDPVEQIISKPEDLEVGTELTVYTATDPDTARTQTVTYGVGTDRAGWVSVDRDTGLIRVKSSMDRESPFVKDGKYKVLILAVDDVPATGTGTLVIELEDVNDNAPVIEERVAIVCNKYPAPILLSVTDKDGPGFAAPFTVELQGESRIHWNARMNETGRTLKSGGEYNVVLRVFDSTLLFQDNTIQASVHDCTGEELHLNLGCPNFFCWGPEGEIYLKSRATDSVIKQIMK